MNFKNQNVRLHRQINTFLIAIVVLLGAYILLAPIMPAVKYQWQKASGFDRATYTVAALSGKSIDKDIKPRDNRLVIPAIGLDEFINEGQGSENARFGVWHLPSSSSPDLGGNTVFAGHRYTYSLDIARPFYNLDKVDLDDEIVVFWKSKIYYYRVVKKSVVSANDSSSETATQDERLTIFTRTPAWTSHNRLVVIANLEKTQ